MISTLVIISNYVVRRDSEIINIKIMSKRKARIFRLNDVLKHISTMNFIAYFSPILHSTCIYLTLIEVSWTDN